MRKILMGIVFALLAGTVHADPFEMPLCVDLANNPDENYDTSAAASSAAGNARICASIYMGRVHALGEQRLTLAEELKKDPHSEVLLRLMEKIEADLVRYGNLFEKLDKKQERIYEKINGPSGSKYAQQNVKATLKSRLSFYLKPVRTPRDFHFYSRSI